MKKIYKDTILNIEWSDIFDNIFLFEYFTKVQSTEGVEIIYLKDILEKRKNEEILQKVREKPAMYSEVYSPKDELEIFIELFENALKNKKKIHIIWVTLWEEIKMLEEYYEELGFMREDINCFDIDFSINCFLISSEITDWKRATISGYGCGPTTEPII